LAIIVETVSLDEIKERILFFFHRIFRSKIFRAIENGDESEVLTLATQKRLTTAKNEYGLSPLIVCIGKEKSDLACKLIELGGSYKGDGALICAAMAGDQAVVEKLLKHGVDPDDTSGNPPYHERSTALMWATNRHYFGIMKSLLDAGADVNAVSENKTTAVMYTRNADKNDLIALKILLENKPDITIRDWRGRNLIQEAQDRNRCSNKPEMLNLLKQYYPETNLGHA
jgi:ankyrin repeat protein